MMTSETTTLSEVANLHSINISNSLTMSDESASRFQVEGLEPNPAFTIVFVPYILFEIPSHILMKRLNLSIWLSGSILRFGVRVLC